jgi:hypothetical protein
MEKGTKVTYIATGEKMLIQEKVDDNLYYCAIDPDIENLQDIDNAKYISLIDISELNQGWNE